MSWQLRLYDQGKRRGPPAAEGYGEQLDPRTFIVHTHQEVAGYPGIGGVMRACLYPWMFCRWVEKFGIAYLEKFGAPFIWAEVPKNTPKQVRDDMLSDLSNMTAEHAAVVEEGDKIHIESAGSQAKSTDGYETYLQSNRANMAKAWLGASDITDPGKSGSQAAVTTRASVTLDPRMVTDGTRLAARCSARCSSAW
jgi:phage gp29-like protein